LASWVAFVAIDPSSTQTVYAGAWGGGLYKSIDGGQTWTVIYGSLGYVSALTLDPSDPSTIYAASAYGGLFRSADGGTTWSDLGLDSDQVTALAVDPSDPQTLYAGTGAGEMFKSSDGGATWQRLGNGFPQHQPVDGVAIDPANPATVFAGTNRVEGIAGLGVYRTTDGGQSWSAASAGLTNRDVDALAMEPSGATIYAATGGGGVFVYPLA